MDSAVYSAVLKTIPFVFVVVAIIAGILRHRSARRHQCRGIQWLLALRLLITHLQRHRGLALGVLGGERTLLAALDDARLHVARDLEYIASIGDWTAEHEGWQSIVQHWGRLSGNVLRLSARHSLEQHNRLIQNSLFLIEEVANAHYLNRFPGKPGSLWRELLTLAEYVGQLRATGMALAAGASSGLPSELVSMQKLDGLIKEIYQLLESPDYAVGLNEELLQGIIDFLRDTDELFLRQEVSISASEYYTIATRALDGIYDRFDNELGMIRQRLQL